ncbi:G-type lectin S-receptor-like serine/threonine-protein kinase [Apostasia shenzhenica]|uniref:Receptor-like serine/threonine-protein kinase n=1 Tax=Apostasia shenzhenica TaxID=1088818 RepID=A0A2I0AW80_9ASPA|nr:G-type lectin S-receptor-like serine/threonine-protein kinase [Apostasia shenzhenica]
MACLPPISVVFLLPLCLVALAQAQSDDPRATIAIGHSITASNDSVDAAWYSPSHLFAFGFYWERTGFAIGIWLVPNFTVLWTADRDGDLLSPGTRLLLTEDGLQIPNPNGDHPISSISATSIKLNSAAMRDSGNFVILNVNGKTMWQTFDYPTDTLLSGQLLPAGQMLVSSVSATDHSSGRFCLSMQNDSNLVLYPMNTPDTGTHAYWASGTNGDGYTATMLNFRGRLIQTRELNLSSQNFSDSSPFRYYGKIEPDGIFRIYFVNQSYSALSDEFPSIRDKCDVKGSCGENSYCNSSASGEAECLCLPGFVYINQSKPFMGCQSNFTREQCGGKEKGNITLSIQRLLNISWVDDHYNKSGAGTVDECGNSCLRDCNCYAALFHDDLCWKQRHPLQYARRYLDAESTVVALLKVGSGDPPLAVQAPPAEEIHRVPSNKCLVLSVVLASAFILTMATVSFFLFLNLGRRYQKRWRNMEICLEGGLAPRCFSYWELKKATVGFQTVVGEGGYATVFIGELCLGRGKVVPIVVKKLKKKLTKEDQVKQLKKKLEELKKKKKMMTTEDDDQVKQIEEKLKELKKEGEQEKPGAVKWLLDKWMASGELVFQTEMSVVGKAHHRHLVRLIGFCRHGSKWLLVYEYLSRGSLEKLIFNTSSHPSWKQRADIAKQVARGLLYLHEGCETAIIHGDVKPENVLIGDDFTAKIADLGLAKLLQPGKSETYTKQRGTAMYMAPDWAPDMTEPVTLKVDVFSFGILLLELISCRKFFDFEEEDRYRILS